MTDKYRPELALFSTTIKNNTTPNIALSKISGGSGTITLEQPMELSIEKPIKTITPVSIAETVDSKSLDVAASGTITKEQSKEINQDETEVIEQEKRDVPVFDYPIIDEDFISPPKDDSYTPIEMLEVKIEVIGENLKEWKKRLEILENKKSLTERVIKWIGDKLKWR